VWLQGALLIGGESRRMGRAKAQIPLGDTTWGCYLYELLRKVTGREPVLVGKGSIGEGGASLPRVGDRRPGAGPLSAILGLYAAYPDADFLVLACDLPGMQAAELRWLINEASGSDRAVVWPRFPDRHHGEPLAACYRAEARRLLEDAWSRGERGLRTALPVSRRHEPVIPETYLSCFANYNRPEDLAHLWDTTRATPVEAD